MTKNLNNDNPKLKFSQLLSKKDFTIISIFFVVVFSLLFYTFFSSNYYKGPEPQFLEIRKGQPFSVVIDSLYSRGIIPSKFNFRVAAFIYGAERNVQAARYHIPNGLSYLELLDLLVGGHGDLLLDIRINDGMSVARIAERLHSLGVVDSQAFHLKSFEEDFVKRKNIKAYSLEGYLLPGNYFFYKNSNAEEILDSMLSRTKLFFNDSLKNQAKKLGYSKHQILTLASIVDGETNKIAEMPKISGVYFNRLKRGIKLQADPTVQYALGTSWRRLFHSDLRIDNLYNTYRHYGLPPGPINNPGENAILATLFPEKHNYIFFVADTKGGHNFSTNYSTHKKYARQYYRWLNSRTKN